MSSPIARRLVGAWFCCGILLVMLSYAVLRHIDQAQSLERQQVQAERYRQELLALRIDLQTLLSAESSQLAQLDLQSQQLAEQAQQLALYRQVLTSDGNNELLLAQEEITPLATPGLFSYRLVLLQPTHTDRRITGLAQIKVRALQAGVSVLLSDDSLGITPVTLDFRHFQVLSGLLQLPIDSQAQTLELQLELDNQTSRTLSLNWPIADNT